MAPKKRPVLRNDFGRNMIINDVQSDTSGHVARDFSDMMSSLVESSDSLTQPPQPVTVKPDVRLERDKRKSHLGDEMMKGPGGVKNLGRKVPQFQDINSYNRTLRSQNRSTGSSASKSLDLSDEFKKPVRRAKPERKKSRLGDKFMGGPGGKFNMRRSVVDQVDNNNSSYKGHDEALSINSTNSFNDEKSTTETEARDKPENNAEEVEPSMEETSTAIANTGDIKKRLFTSGAYNSEASTAAITAPVATAVGNVSATSQHHNTNTGRVSSIGSDDGGTTHIHLAMVTVNDDNDELPPVGEEEDISDVSAQVSVNLSQPAPTAPATPAASAASATSSDSSSTTAPACAPATENQALSASLSLHTSKRRSASPSVSKSRPTEVSHNQQEPSHPQINEATTPASQQQSAVGDTQHVSLSDRQTKDTDRSGTREKSLRDGGKGRSNVEEVNSSTTSSRSSRKAKRQCVDSEEAVSVGNANLAQPAPTAPTANTTSAHGPKRPTTSSDSSSTTVPACTPAMENQALSASNASNTQKSLTPHISKRRSALPPVSKTLPAKVSRNQQEPSCSPANEATTPASQQQSAVGDTQHVSLSDRQTKDTDRSGTREKSLRDGGKRRSNVKEVNISSRRAKRQRVDSEEAVSVWNVSSVSGSSSSSSGDSGDTSSVFAESGELTGYGLTGSEGGGCSDGSASTVPGRQGYSSGATTSTFSTTSATSPPTTSRVPTGRGRGKVTHLSPRSPQQLTPGTPVTPVSSGHAGPSGAKRGKGAAGMLRKKAIENSQRKRYHKEKRQVQLDTPGVPPSWRDIETNDISSTLTDSVVVSPIHPGRSEGEFIRLTPTKRHYYKQLRYKRVPREYHSDAWQLNLEILSTTEREERAPGARRRYPARRRVPAINRLHCTIAGYDNLRGVEPAYEWTTDQHGSRTMELAGLFLPSLGGQLEDGTHKKKKVPKLSNGKDECNITAVMPLNVMDVDTQSEKMKDCVWRYTGSGRVTYGAPESRCYIAHSLDVMRGRRLKFCGALTVEPAGDKPHEVTDSDLLFVVTSGKAAVTIHHTEVLLRASDQFCVPAGNAYSIRNNGKSQLRLAITIFDQ